jgi:hypothetical protein
MVSLKIYIQTFHIHNKQTLWIYQNCPCSTVLGMDSRHLLCLMGSNITQFPSDWSFFWAYKSNLPCRYVSDHSVTEGNSICLTQEFPHESPLVLYLPTTYGPHFYSNQAVLNRADTESLLWIEDNDLHIKGWENLAKSASYWNSHAHSLKRNVVAWLQKWMEFLPFKKQHICKQKHVPV